jgi:hypothetical protein
MKFKIKLNIKKILKAFGKGILNTFTMLTISIGSILAFASYINPVPTIAQQFPNLIIGTYTLELLFNDVKWWQSLGYIAWSISGGLIVFGLAIHIRSIGRLWRGIKATPRAIINTPVNTYRKLRAGRDWLFHKIEYLNSESKKWKMAFNIAKVPYTILTKAGFSPQMAISLLAVGGTVGSGIVVNETVLKDRTFENGDAGYYSSNNATGNINIPDETLEQALKRQDSDNTLRIIVKTVPIQSVIVENLSIGTAYNSSTLPTYASNTGNALIVEGTNSSTLSIVTYLEVGELIFEENRCDKLILRDIETHNIELVGNSADGLSISQTVGTGRQRAIIGGHFQSKSLRTEYGLFDFFHLSADTNGKNGKIGKLHIKNVVSKGGACLLNRIKADTIKIHKNYVGADSNLATKDFVVEGTVSAVHWLAEDNIEMLISPPTAQPLNNN